MKNSFCSKIIAIFVLFSITACAYRVTPDVSSRRYEVNNVSTLTNAVERAFTKAGYTTSKAKLEETVSTTKTGGGKNESKTYTYGPAELTHNGSFYRCMKLGSAKITPEAEKSLYVVQLQAAQVTCYQSIGKVDLSIETDKEVYDNYFNALSHELGQEGKKIGAQ